jgi:hypothetical protein
MVHSSTYIAISRTFRGAVPSWQTGGRFSSRFEILHAVFGHHCPDRLKDVLDAIGKRP